MRLVHFLFKCRLMFLTDAAAVNLTMWTIRLYFNLIDIESTNVTSVLRTPPPPTKSLIAYVYVLGHHYILCWSVNGSRGKSCGCAATGLPLPDDLWSLALECHLLDKYRGNYRLWKSDNGERNSTTLRKTYIYLPMWKEGIYIPITNSK